MMVPDFALIAEIMLQSEGLKDARVLAQKIVTLYNLMEQQFSKQEHYDFGNERFGPASGDGGRVCVSDRRARQVCER